jgi:uncharacterized membrane protein
MFAQALNQLMARIFGRLATRYIGQFAELLGYWVVASLRATVAKAWLCYCVALLSSSS